MHTIAISFIAAAGGVDNAPKKRLLKALKAIQDLLFLSQATYSTLMDLTHTLDKATLASLLSRMKR